MTILSPAPPGAAPRRALVLMLALGLVLRLLLLLTTQDLGARVIDEQHYILLATSLAEGRGFAMPSGPTSLRPPGYPAFIAAAWLATGTRSLQVVRGLQIVVGLATALLLYALVREIYDEQTGVWAAALTWWYPPLVFTNYLLLTETLFAFLVVVWLLATWRLLRRPSLPRAAVAGAAFALAALTRSVLWPVAPVLALLLAVILPARPGRRMVLATAFFVTVVVVIGPWTVRNTRLWGVPVVVDTMGGMNMRMGNYEYTPQDRMWDAVSMRGTESWIADLPAAAPDGGPWTEAQKDRWGRSKAVEFMRAHPGLTLWRSAIRVGDFWGVERDFLAGVAHRLYRPPQPVTILVGGLMLAAFPAVMLLAILGAWLRPPAEWRVHVIMLAVIGAVCGIHALVFAHPRYRLPFMPILCVYAAAAVRDRSWRRLGPTSGTAVGALATAGVLVTIWIVQFAWRDWVQVAAVLNRLRGAG